MTQEEAEKALSEAACRVGVAKSAVDALQEALRGLKLQHKAAEAKYHQRLGEHTAAILALPKPLGSR